MSDRTNTASDVIRRQQEIDLGHPLDHKPDRRGAPPEEFTKPFKPRDPDRLPVTDRKRATDYGKDGLQQEE